MTQCVDEQTLKTNEFGLVIPNMPNFNATVQDVNVPAVSLGEAQQSTPLNDVPYPGEKITYSTMTASFPLQKNLANYKEIYDWMLGYGHPVSHEKRQPRDDLRKDASIIVMDSATRRPTGSKFVVVDLFPLDMTDIPFDTKSSEEIIITVTFRYLYFYIDTGDCN